MEHRWVPASQQEVFFPSPCLYGTLTLENPETFLSLSEQPQAWEKQCFWLRVDGWPCPVRDGYAQRWGAQQANGGGVAVQRQASDWDPAFGVGRCERVSFRALLKPPGLQFLHLEDRDSHGPYFIKLLQSLNEIYHGKFSLCLEHSGPL